MDCLQHSCRKNRRIPSADEPYCRDADWWKKLDHESIEKPKHRYAAQSGGSVRAPVKKAWSILIFSRAVVKGGPTGKRKMHTAELEEEFNTLVDQWRRETSFHSSLGEIFTNDAYQRIMAMGKEALPLILSELSRKSGHWYYALEKIVGRDVAVGAKSFADARSAWLKWGQKNNYL